MDLGLEGKAALVIGASSAIGRATALELAQEGVKVVVAGRNREALEDTAGRIKSAGGWAHVGAGDLSSTEAVKALVADTVAATGGRIDLLANTAGPFPLRGLDKKWGAPMYADDESWEEAFNGILMSAVRLTREVMPIMKAQGGGAIVHLGSNSARYYKPMTSQFAAMKAGLVHVTKNWARDGAPYGVRVNAVLPGWVLGDKSVPRLEAAAKAAGKSVREVEREEVQGHDNLYWADRMGRGDEYAAAIIFLLSARASYITGALVPVDGGTPVWG